jgi:hypothetical protein
VRILARLLSPLSERFDIRHDLALGGRVGGKFVGYDPLRRTSLIAQKPCQRSPRSLCAPVGLRDFVVSIPRLDRLRARDSAFSPLMETTASSRDAKCHGGSAPFTSGGGRSRRQTWEGLFAPIGARLPPGLGVVTDDEGLPVLPDLAMAIIKSRNAVQPLTDTLAQLILSTFSVD